MKKIIINILIGLSIFFGISGYIFASVEPFFDINGVSYDGNFITIDNGDVKSYEVGELLTLSSTPIAGNGLLYVIYIKIDGSKGYFRVKTGYEYSFFYNGVDSNMYYYNNFNTICLNYIDSVSGKNRKVIFNNGMTSGSYGFCTGEILSSGQYIINGVLYGGVPTAPEITDTGTFGQSSAGFKYKDIQTNLYSPVQIGPFLESQNG